MARAFAAVLALTLACVLLAPTALVAQEARGTAIRIILGDTVILGTLDDSAPARDFAAMLPLEIELSPYHDTEMVGDLGRVLDRTGMPDAYEPQAGDITQYAPWQNLAIFIKPFSTSRGLVRLGQIDGAFDALVSRSDITVRIEAAPGP